MDWMLSIILWAYREVEVGSCLADSVLRLRRGLIRSV